MMVIVNLCIIMYCINKKWKNPVSISGFLAEEMQIKKGRLSIKKSRLSRERGDVSKGYLYILKATLEDAIGVWKIKYKHAQK